MSLFNQILENTENNLKTSTEALPQPSPEVAQDYRGRNQEFFTVEKHPVSGPYGTIPKKKGLFVNKKNINIVSDHYEVHQPTEICKAFEDAANTTGLKVNRVLTNPNNGGLLMSAGYGKKEFLGEDHDVNLTFYTSHCGKYKTFLTLDFLRMACFNQVPAIYKNNKRHIFSEKHYRDALSIDALEKHLEYIPQALAAYEEKAERLNEIKMDFDDFVEAYKQVYTMNEQSKRYDNKVENLRAMYYNATGQRELTDTAYKAFQAVTFQNTHELRDTTYKAENIITKGSDKSLEFLDVVLQETVELAA